MNHITTVGLGILVVAAAIAGATTLRSPSGGGFAQLETWTAVLDAEDAARSHVFEFAAPPEGFRVEGEAVAFVNVPYAVQNALLAPRNDAAVRRLTGFDLPARATATMALDNWPRSLVLFAIDADPSAPQAFTQAYDARNFATETVGGVPVQHIWEDGTTDPTRRSEPADPFEGGVGQPQRVAHVGGTLMGAANWDGIRQGLAGLAAEADCAACLPWREVVAALRSEAGGGAHLYMADGWGAQAFRTETPPAEAGLPIPLSALPPFDAVLFAATRTGGTHAVHLVVRFPDAADAEAGLAEITKRMNAAVTLRGRPETRLTIAKGTIHRAAGAAIAVLTIGPNDGTATTAAAAFSAMGSLVLGREFLGLAWN